MSLPSVHPCSDCGACCTYVATQIDDPNTFQQYENIHWYLTHENVGVYIDWEGDWFIEFQTRCRHLTEQKTCAIYEERPRVCSEFSFTECERATKEPGWKHYFRSQAELVDFLREKRPRAYERCLRKRRELVQKRRRAGRAKAALSEAGKLRSGAQ